MTTTKTTTGFSKPNGEVPELEVRVSPSWIRFIRWCQVNVPYGQVCVKINNAEPGDLVPEHTKKRVRFDKEDTIPNDFNPYS